AESARLRLPERGELTMTPLHGAVLRALDGGGGLFFRMLSDRVAALGNGHPPDDADLVAAIWDLAWAGRLTNDTLAPLRVLTGGGPAVRRGGAPPPPPPPPPAPRPALPPRAVPVPGVFTPRPSAPAVRRFGGGSRRPAMPSRTGPPTVTGRWSLLPDRVADAGGPAATMRAHAQALTLLERHGVLTKGAVAAERVNGGVRAGDPVLRAMEENRQCRRRYFLQRL